MPPSSSGACPEHSSCRWGCSLDNSHSLKEELQPLCAASPRTATPYTGLCLRWGLQYAGEVALDSTRHRGVWLVTIITVSAVVGLSTACGLTVHPFAISFTAVCTCWSQRSLGVKLGVKQEPEDEPALLPTAQLLSLRSWPQLLSLRSWLCISHLGPADRLLPRHHALMHTCFVPIRFPALCSTPHTAFWFSAVVH